MQKVNHFPLFVKVYKQKVKHLLYEHQNNITELKRDGRAKDSLQAQYANLCFLGVVSLTLEQSQHNEREKDVVLEKRELKVPLCVLSHRLKDYQSRLN